MYFLPTHINSYFLGILMGMLFTHNKFQAARKARKQASSLNNWNLNIFYYFQVILVIAVLLCMASCVAIYKESHAPVSSYVTMEHFLKASFRNCYGCLVATVIYACCISDSESRTTKPTTTKNRVFSCCGFRCSQPIFKQHILAAVTQTQLQRVSHQLCHYEDLLRYTRPETALELRRNRASLTC